jgi:hypothetical protein
VRLSVELQERVRARARLERRTFSNTLRVLIERGLDDAVVYVPSRDGVAEDEVERLAEVAREALRGHGR